MSMINEKSEITEIEQQIFEKEGHPNERAIRVLIYFV